jgi:hypothetical protein
MPFVLPSATLVAHPIDFSVTPFPGRSDRQASLMSINSLNVCIMKQEIWNFQNGGLNQPGLLLGLWRRRFQEGVVYFAIS